METNTTEAFGAALRELLDAPFHIALRALGATGELPLLPADIATVRDMLAHESPPLELLDAIFLTAQQSTTVLRSVADVIQLATLAVGVIRCDVEVPIAERPQMRSLYELAITLPWVDEQTKELLDDGFVALSSLEEFAARPVEAGDEPAKTEPKAVEPPHPATLHEVLVDVVKAEAAKPRRSAERSQFPRVAAAVLVLAMFAVGAYYSVQFVGMDDGPRYEGWIESIDGQKVTGWAWDSRNPTKPVEVELSDGVHSPIVVLADLNRGDLGFRGDNTANHGFVYWTAQSDVQLSGPIVGRIKGTSCTLNSFQQTVASAR
jgi:hypothetical protein